MLRIDQVKIPIGHSQGDLKKKTAQLLKIGTSDILEVRILRHLHFVQDSHRTTVL